MCDPLDRYDRGHRPTVGKLTGPANAETDRTALLTLDAVRQLSGMKCHIPAYSMPSHDPMWMSAGSCTNLLIRSPNLSTGGRPGTPSSRHVPGNPVVALNQGSLRHFEITRRGPATLFGGLRPRLAKATGRDIRPASRGPRGVEVAGD